MVQLIDIIDAIRVHNPGADVEPVKKAYAYAEKVHQGQIRRSGEPYLHHPLEVALILCGLHMDIPSIVAGILHDTVEDTVATLEEIESLFGTEVRLLVDGVTKLSQIRFRTTEEKQAENFRKMIMAMAQDIRVIMIKVSDRLHNMRTLFHLPEHKQVIIARETLDIYAPISNRLGLQQIKMELEDLCLRYLKPNVFHLINTKLEQRQTERQGEIDEIKNVILSKLHEHNINGKLYGRMKHVYSVHRKMEKQHIPFDEVHDIVGFRVIVENIQQCYEALGIIHSMWRPVPGRFKDYIAMPKANHYQSLHTTVICLHGERVEFQIRTKEMHDIAEHGIAAHWQYKEGKLVNDKDEMKFKWIRRLLQWQRELSDPTEFLDTVKLDLFADDVYVFTPKGELREFPNGSTPVDFSYSVHTNLGNSTIGAKVNGKIVSLRYKLKSGDTVEIIKQKQQRPNKDWLQFVKTSRAKAKIRQFLRSEEHDQSAAIGKNLLEKAAERTHLSLSDILSSDAVEKFAKESSYDSVEKLLVPIGYGKISAQQIVNLVLTERGAETKSPEEISVKRPQKPSSREPIKVCGMSNMLVSFGKCCNPIAGDSILGYITRGRGVSIHRSDCPRIIGLDPERTIEAEWDTSVESKRVAKIKVVCLNKPGLLAGMTDAITKQGANIAAASIKTSDDNTATNYFDVEIKDTAQLRFVMKALERISGIISVERSNG